MKHALTVDDIRGLAGIVPTPATADASDWRTTQSVNLSETERMVRIMADSGMDILMTTGTFGECASLTPRELVDYVACVVDSADGAMPVFGGLTTLNTRDTIARGRELLNVGATGLFVGRPMWLALDDRGIVRYYTDLAEALPGVPMVIYDNPMAFKGKISSAAYRELAKIPELVAAKHVGGPALEQDMLDVGENMRILPNDEHWYSVAHKHPDLSLACWSGGVGCAPAPLMALRDAILQRDWELASRITQKIHWAVAPMFPEGALEKFMDYSIQIGHARFKAAGLIQPGPPRPPYTEAPESFIAGGLECGRRWATLQQEFINSRTTRGDTNHA